MATLRSRFAPETPAAPSGRFCAKLVQTISSIQPKKEVISVKRWQKILGCVLIIVVAAAILFFTWEPQCCLCDSFRYHAVCLIDLEKGEVRELDLYFPHESLVAELADPQPERGIFSFVSIGNVSGTKQTAPERIDLHIPEDSTFFPALCSDCRKQLPFGYTSRYVFADLYGMEEKILIPIEADTAFSLRCYDVTTQPNTEKGGISVVIQGTLD